jgi:hypothetical protein
VAKRSPILGYNHNVRYRGLVFHVQTEDSGILSPHLFTHLFHGGVIVSTRKLVYDAGSAEDTIKSLMQAQHKAVLKDLKRGTFDDKIDQYLGGTPGLLPRGSDDGDGERPVTSAMAPLPKVELPEGRAAAVPLSSLDLDSSPVPVPVAAAPDVTVPMAPPEMAAPRVPTPPAATRAPTPPAAPRANTPSGPQPAVAPPATARTRTAERTSGTMRASVPTPMAGVPLVTPPAGIAVPVAPLPRATTPPPVITSAPTIHDDLDPPTFVDPRAPTRAVGPVAHLDNPNTRPTMNAAELFDEPPVPRRTRNSDLLDNKPTLHDVGPPIPTDFSDIQSSPEIEMTLEVDDDDDDDHRAHPRAHRDTEVSAPTPMQSLSDGIPRARTPDSAPPLPPPPGSVDKPIDKRVGASALGPGKSVTRPPAVSVVSSRPLSNSDGRDRHESEAVEVYAPPPSSIPDQVPQERPGQYSLRRSKPVGAVEPPPAPVREAVRDRAASTPIPSGLARPGARSGSIRALNATTPEPMPTTQPLQRVTNPAASSTQTRMPRPGDSNSGPLRTSTPRSSTDVDPPPRPRSPTPARISPPAAPPNPTAPRTQTTSPVVMTRPAVIVGAPAKSTTQRVRKAREDEGRGFGQGLISEKSLDEVILAYLSEDAEEK